MPDSTQNPKPADQTAPPPAPSTPDMDAQRIEELKQELTRIAQETREEVIQDPAFAQTLAVTPQMQDMVINVEEELLYEIVKRLEENKISQEKAQQVAKEFLSFLPIQDQKDLLDKLKKLSQDNSEVQGIYLKYAKPYEEYDRHTKIKQMSEHIKKGNIEEALAIAKEGGKNV